MIWNVAVAFHHQILHWCPGSTRSQRIRLCTKYCGHFWVMPRCVYFYIYIFIYTWGFPKMVVSNNHWVFLLKMIMLGCEMGVPPFKETPTPLGFMRSLKILKRRRVQFAAVCVQFSPIGYIRYICPNRMFFTLWKCWLWYRLVCFVTSVEEKVLRGIKPGITMHTDLWKKDHQFTSSHHSHNLPQDIDGGEVQLDCGPEHLLDLAEA